MADHSCQHPRIVFFGHFGAGNFGNEATLQAMLWNIRRWTPNAELMCVTTFPAKVMGDYGIKAIPISEVLVKPWGLRNSLVNLARKFLVGIPSEILRWFKTVATLWHCDMLIVVGTGLLTDAFCLGSWGPYSVFKWSVAAKLCGCKLHFVSTGAGPLDSRLGRFLIKSAISVADFRSYRDEATLEYLKRIGFRVQNDRIFPDLAYSLPAAMLPQDSPCDGHRLSIGLGLMTFDGMYGVEKTTAQEYSAYCEILSEFVKWLVDRGYEVRLLIGDLSDERAVQKFKSLLERHSIAMDRVIAEPITSIDNLLKQIAATDLVVATRFHNVLLSLLLNKPSIAISFHHKCSSLMDQMGFSDYCQAIQNFTFDRLIGQFCSLEKNAAALKKSILSKTETCRAALDEQYELIFGNLRSQSRSSLPDSSEKVVESHGTLLT